MVTFRIDETNKQSRTKNNNTSMIIWRPLKLKHNNKMSKGGVIVVLKTKIVEVSAF